MLLNRQANEEPDEHIDMTPMVDVVFQLMTFMLFSMQPVSAETIKVPDARHGTVVDESTATIVMMVAPATPGARPKLLVGIGGKEMSSSDQVCVEVSRGVAAGRRKVVIQADKAVAHGDVVALMGEIAKRESSVSIHVGVKAPED